MPNQTDIALPHLGLLSCLCTAIHQNLRGLRRFPEPPHNPTNPLLPEFTLSGSEGFFCVSKDFGFSPYYLDQISAILSQIFCLNPRSSAQIRGRVFIPFHQC